VEIGVEGFSDGVDGGDPVFGKKPIELGLDQFHSGNDGRCIRGGGGGLESEFEMVEQGKEVREDGLIGVFEGFLLFPNEAFAGIFKVRLSAEKLVFEGSDFRCGIGGRRRIG